MSTSVASLNPRLISTVSPDPGRLLVAAAAELARRWAESNHYDFDEHDAVADLGCLRDALASLASVLDPDSESSHYNLHDWARGLADDRAASVHAGKRATQAHVALATAARELGHALDRFDQGFAG
jgi:hypothetical protein